VLVSDRYGAREAGDGYWPIAACREPSNQDCFVGTGLFSSEVICRVDGRHCAPPIRAATRAAITLGNLPSAAPVLTRSDNVEREIETTESDISGCHPRDDKFANVIVYS
jgi:hypothetical protein